MQACGGAPPQATAQHAQHTSRRGKPLQLEEIAPGANLSVSCPGDLRRKLCPQASATASVRSTRAHALVLALYDSPSLHSRIVPIQALQVCAPGERDAISAVLGQRARPDGIVSSFLYLMSISATNIIRGNDPTLVSSVRPAMHQECGRARVPSPHAWLTYVTCMRGGRHRAPARRPCCKRGSTARSCVAHLRSDD